MKTGLVVCALIVAVNLWLVQSASLGDPKTFDHDGPFLFKKRPTTTTRRPGQPICPGNNPPPACRSADVCTDDKQCFRNEICCRTSFGGKLLNTSCCVSADRGPQCPAVVSAGTCVTPNEECGGSSECPGGQVCCSIGGSATLRCCVFPMCSTAITAINQCIAAVLPAAAPTVCDGGTNACAPLQRCCHPGNSGFPCCVLDPLTG